jgi:hypothetical protein
MESEHDYGWFSDPDEPEYGLRQYVEGEDPNSLMDDDNGEGIGNGNDGLSTGRNERE